MTKKEKIAILIPCYNEEKTIEAVIKDFKKNIPEAQIYVYDNNSTDNTAKNAKKNGAIVRSEHKQGKGNVVRTMFQEIDADFYILVDGDNTYPAIDGKKLVSYIIKDGYDMVIGDRLSTTYFQQNKRLFHNFGNKLVRFLINKLFKSNIKDIMTGYRAFSKKFVKSFPILSKGFEIETEMTIHALDKNFSILEIPINYKDRPTGSQSKLHTIKDGYKVLKTIFKLFEEYKPLAFFSITGLIFLITSLAFGIPVFVEYFETGLVLRFPTLIFAGILLIISILLFVTGIILDIIVKKHRQLYELFLLKNKE